MRASSSKIEYHIQETNRRLATIEQKIDELLSFRAKMLVQTSIASAIAAIILSTMVTIIMNSISVGRLN